MRILVLGAGAVGGYFGALLARGGHDVTFVARGENLAALGARGLVVRLGSETLHLAPVRAVPDPALSERIARAVGRLALAMASSPGQPGPKRARKPAPARVRP